MDGRLYVRRFLITGSRRSLVHPLKSIERKRANKKLKVLEKKTEDLEEARENADDGGKSGNRQTGLGENNKERLAVERERERVQEGMSLRDRVKAILKSTDSRWWASRPPWVSLLA